MLSALILGAALLGSPLVSPAQAAPPPRSSATTIQVPGGSITIRLSDEDEDDLGPVATGGPGIASATFAGLDPARFSVILAGQQVAYEPRLQAFLAPELAPGAYAFVLFRDGRQVMTADLTVVGGTHSACTILPQLHGYGAGCANGGPPYRRADLAPTGSLVPTGPRRGPPGIAIPGPSMVAPPPPPALPVGPTAMSSTAFAGLVQAVKAASFGSDQVDILRTAAVGNHFRCEQVATLLGLMSFSSNQLDAVKALRPAIIDPENAWQLEAPFSFSSDKEQVRALFR